MWLKTRWKSSFRLQRQSFVSFPYKVISLTHNIDINTSQVYLALFRAKSHYDNLSSRSTKYQSGIQRANCNLLDSKTWIIAERIICTNLKEKKIYRLMLTSDNNHSQYLPKVKISSQVSLRAVSITFTLGQCLNSIVIIYQH